MFHVFEDGPTWLMVIQRTIQQLLLTSWQLLASLGSGTWQTHFECRGITSSRNSAVAFAQIGPRSGQGQAKRDQQCSSRTQHSNLQRDTKTISHLRQFVAQKKIVLPRQQLLKPNSEPHSM